MVLAAVAQTSLALQYADDSLLNDDAFLQEALDINADVKEILPYETFAILRYSSHVLK